MKELPSHLKYEFLEPEKRKPVIISAALTEAEEQKLLVILRKYKEAIKRSSKLMVKGLKQYLGEKQLEDKPLVINEKKLKKQNIGNRKSS